MLRSWRKVILIGGAVLLGSLVPYLANAESPKKWVTEYLTRDQALQKAFPGAEFTKHIANLSPDLRTRVSGDIGVEFLQPSLTYFTAKKNGEVQGVAWIVDELGKHYPMTFLVAVGPKHRVKSVHMMVYREQIGDQVRKRRFWRQFVGKSESDPIEVGRDVDSITGATISSWSMATGVKRVLILTRELKVLP